MPAPSPEARSTPHQSQWPEGLRLSVNLTDLVRNVHRKFLLIPHPFQFTPTEGEVGKDAFILSHTSGLPVTKCKADSLRRVRTLAELMTINGWSCLIDSLRFQPERSYPHLTWSVDVCQIQAKCQRLSYPVALAWLILRICSKASDKNDCTEFENCMGGLTKTLLHGS